MTARSHARAAAVAMLPVSMLLVAAPSQAQDAAAQDLAKALANPIASLVQVPLQQNLDFGYGQDGKGWRATTNIQPVIPLSISEDWNMISRTIVPIIYQDGVTGSGSSQFGLGDTVQSIFFSPKSTASGIIWGAGPVFLLPTGTSRALGGEKWGVGATAVVLKQNGPMTIGALANHIWSVPGSSSRGDVSVTFVQPFFSYATPAATTYTLSSEISYDWIGNNRLVPVNVTVAQLGRIGRQPVQFSGGAKLYVASPAGGPDWGLRFGLTFLFPK